MDSFTPSFFCFFLIFISAYSAGLAGASSRHHHREWKLEASGGFRPTKLFVFGDSYADTGNVRKSLGTSWKEPYGTTFPGKPAGRFSDGRVLTDYLAKFLGLKSPFAYEWMKMGGKKLRNGMNFAYGGSGVFDTYDMLPNMSTQINFFEKLIKDSFYTKFDVQSSVALVSLSGNDYGAYMAKGGTLQGVQSFIPRVIDQLAVNLKRIYGLGVGKVAVTSLQPLGCLPQTTRMSSYQQCNTTQNLAVVYHNVLLQQAVTKLNNVSKSSSFFILDLYRSFTTVLGQRQGYQGNLKFESLLKPCCVGMRNNYSCGSVDDHDHKMYTVCKDPKTAFFWDESHPTEAGWHAVYAMLKSCLEQFLS